MMVYRPLLVFSSFSSSSALVPIVSESLEALRMSETGEVVSESTNVARTEATALTQVRPKKVVTVCGAQGSKSWN